MIKINRNSLSHIDILLMGIFILLIVNFTFDNITETSRYEIDNNLIKLGSNLVETDKRIAGQIDGLLRIIEIQEMQILDLRTQVNELRNP